MSIPGNPIEGLNSAFICFAGETGESSWAFHEKEGSGPGGRIVSLGLETG